MMQREAGMSGGNEPQPIIIVRRRRMEEDGHHGGAWKIAFADFMTAMMALFLVLWLVNASDTDTRKAVASYFNPVKLVERERSRRGLAEPGVKADADPAAADAPVDAQPDAEALTEAGARADAKAGAVERGEETFLADPEAFLDRRARAALEDAALNRAASQDAAETALTAPDRPRDPFAVASGEALLEASGEALGAPTPETVAEPPAAGQPPEAVTEPREPAVPEPEAPRPAGSAGEAPQQAALLEEVRRELERSLPGDAALRAALRVEAVEGGTLISLADGPGFAMFDSGSFAPTGRAILAMQAIARVLEGRQGAVRVHGHTDSTPFRGPGDNWRLSTDRAHAARLMLARGGLDGARLSRVTGFAASRPVEGLDPGAARNRRIDVLLEAP